MYYMYIICIYIYMPIYGRRKAMTSTSGPVRELPGGKMKDVCSRLSIFRPAPGAGRRRPCGARRAPLV